MAVNMVTLARHGFNVTSNHTDLHFHLTTPWIILMCTPNIQNMQEKMKKYLSEKKN